MMYLLPKLLSAAPRFSLTFTAEHIPGVLKKVTEAMMSLVPVPIQLLEQLTCPLVDSRATHHPVTDNTLLIVFNSLDLIIPDNTMFWAACNLANFVFFCSAKFTIPTLASFSPDVHLSLEATAFHSYEMPAVLHSHC